jgi:hypothetical protein
MTDQLVRTHGADPITTILTGNLFSYVGYAIAVLGIPDVLADQVVHLDQIAERSGADADALLQLMRTGAGLGVFVEAPPRFFALTQVGQRLRSDHPQSRHGSLIRMVERNGPILAEILHTMRTGRPAWEKVHGTAMYDEPDGPYNLHLHDSPQLNDMLTSYDMSNVRTVVDIAGGDGRVVSLLLRTHPHLRGVLFERPSAIALATQVMDAAIVARCDLVEGSFFETVPGGGDLYLITRVLHNWNDDAAVAILRTVRAAMPAGARLLVAERFMARNEHEPVTLSLNMLMLLLNGGHERTEQEYRDLMDRSGFTVNEVWYSAAPAATPAESLLEVTPK